MQTIKTKYYHYALVFYINIHLFKGEDSDTSSFFANSLQNLCSEGSNASACSFKAEMGGGMVLHVTL